MKRTGISASTSTSTSTLGTLALAVLAATLAACGGGDGGGTGTTGPSGPTTPTTPVTPSTSFTQSGTWTFTLPAAGASICYDFNAQAPVADCSGNNWDLKVKAAARSASLWTNSGSSGTGNGGAFGGPFDHTWTELQAWKNATTDPVNGAIPSTLYFKDAAAGVFTSSNDIASAAFEYGVGGSNDHLLYPTWRTFVITTDNSSADAVGTVAAPVFALQVAGYYGGTGGTTSGHPSFRWVDRANPGVVRTATVDATADWVYYDLVNAQQTTATGTWHIAFSRYNIKLNGGESGTGKVAGFVGRTPAGFYDASNKPVAARFTDAGNATATLADLSAADLAVPAAASSWVKDANASPLSPAYTGTYPNPLNYGWYTYHPTAAAAAAAGLPAVAHLLKANPDAATLVRGGEGTTYARIHLLNIQYANPSDSASAQTWTIAFDVQP